MSVSSDSGSSVLPRGVIDVEQELTVLLRRARGTSQEFARQVHPELENDAYGLLVRLDQVDGERGTDLAAFFGVGKPTISRQVAMLEKLGLVERHPDTTDGRATVLKITEDGRARIRRMREARQQYFGEMLASWDQADVEQFAHLLHRYNETVFSYR
ncbi:MarR family winged helix-turn-helix transcriptional regulator [Motilibacter deserti]|uniref:MarR family transcriptional regulator n=1 Tax=Motilibacter deserti TaxID=2714956 RepID=A0ABX0H262_9ACTN|nr:MarR family transcriptional regulator [Motilibacter deserti]NHC16134.1 MarR family transcriptional regulator [Motilibacter deserti]